jgi:hypothetical protein
VERPLREHGEDEQVAVGEGKVFVEVHGLPVV